MLALLPRTIEESPDDELVFSARGMETSGFIIGAQFILGGFGYHIVEILNRYEGEPENFVCFRAARTKGLDTIMSGYCMMISGGLYPKERQAPAPPVAKTQFQLDLERVESTMRKFGYSPYGNMFAVYGEYGFFEFRRTIGPPIEGIGKGPFQTESGGTWDSNKETADEFIARMEAKHGKH